jgi:endonuclease YncB( thermonuclease family)
MLDQFHAKRLLGGILFCLALTGPCFASSFAGRVVSVSDGDTIIVLRPGTIQEKVRLAEIDCPEKGQPFGQAAKRKTGDLAAQKTVTVEVRTTDRYGRTVGEVVLPDGSSLNRELVRAGYAWWYRQYSQDESLGALEAEARRERRSLWSEPNPVPPWEWRRGNRTSVVAPNHVAAFPSSADCGQKQFCREMASCEEAMFYLKKCGVSSLDGNGDGVPCEALCK